MREDVRRGRWIISRLAALHTAITAVVAVFSYLRGSPVMNVAVRALSQGFLIHSLWKGSRFSQWMHVLGCFSWAVLAIALGAKRPSPVMWGVCGSFAGFWLWKVKSKEEALEWVKRVPGDPDGPDGEIEIRQVFEMEEFGPELTPELREREDKLRQELEAKK